MADKLIAAGKDVEWTCDGKKYILDIKAYEADVKARRNGTRGN